MKIRLVHKPKLCKGPHSFTLPTKQRFTFLLVRSASVFADLHAPAAIVALSRRTGGPQEQLGLGSSSRPPNLLIRYSFACVRDDVCRGSFASQCSFVAGCRGA